MGEQESNTRAMVAVESSEGDTEPQSPMGRGGLIPEEPADDNEVDEASKESFPASDAPGWSGLRPS